MVTLRDHTSGGAGRLKTLAVESCGHDTRSRGAYPPIMVDKYDEMSRMNDAGDFVDLQTNFSMVAVALFDAGTVQETLQRIVDMAEQAIEGCEAAGIFVAAGRAPSTAAASGPLAFAVDQLQIDAGEGPCLDASNGAGTVYAEDLLDDARWPAFAPAAVALGIRSVLACSLSSGQPNALNLYAHLPAAFSVIDRAQGQLFATLARLALESAEERAAHRTSTGNLTEALRTRELIGQAQGILMERERITSEQAFDVLRRASQHLNVKLREIAATLVETGESPPTGDLPRERGADDSG